MTTLFWISFGALWVMVVLQGLAFMEVLRQVGYLRQQLGPVQGAAVLTGAVPTGEPLPPLLGVTSGHGVVARWDDFLDTDFGVAVFLTTHCITCREVAEHLTGLANDLPMEVSTVAIIQGGPTEVEQFVRETKISRALVVLDEEGSTAKSLQISWNPAALTIAGGRVGKAAIINNVFQIDALVQEEFGTDYADPETTRILPNGNPIAALLGGVNEASRTG